MTNSPLLQYESSHLLYGISFSNSPQHPLRIALSTLVTGPSNKLVVVDRTSPSPDYQQQQSYTHNNYAPSGTSAQNDFRQIASINLNLPATKVGWEPAESLASGGGGYDDAGGRGELLATSGDALRIWAVNRDWAGDSAGSYVGHNGWSGEPSYALRSRSMLSNSKTPHSSIPPVTSFSWNAKSPNSIVTCSIDTTATLWDIQTSQAVTQLIAHDRAVYDLSWLPDSSDIFVSVGADGSLRAFDLRQLEHSTILYESSKESPLARIAFSRKEQYMLACFGVDDQKVMILDMRSPGSPVAELVGHQAPVGAIAWGASGSSSSSPSGGGWVASCGDDSQLLLYDLSKPVPQGKNSGSRSSSMVPSSKGSGADVKSRNTNTNTNSTPYALSPPITPGDQRSPSPAEAVEIVPSKAWTAPGAGGGGGGGGGGEINNLAFSERGDWIGCVTANRLNVLQA